ncbi:2-oxoglutarate-dependent dioxygenase 19-like [Mercurialis annua]|uniref:2-oxoglutarate-dependent dioxygenase 19-like n=1 Tax=Mercurialis annua TaxID=3986 RepID=UPI0021601E0C|nr:2-oxoglutarate-dependent dioxygenase 19-like [Mercurialis annua]
MVVALPNGFILHDIVGERQWIMNGGRNRCPRHNYFLLLQKLMMSTHDYDNQDHLLAHCSSQMIYEDVMLRGLGLEEDYIEKKLKLKSGYDFFTANDYPPLQNYEKQNIGQGPHVDPSLLVFIIENVSGGLQVQHHGKWLNVNLKPGSILVNVADHLEILTNGKYKSVVHRVTVNNEARRVTLPMFMGPSLNTVVSLAQDLVDETNPPAYRSITYKQYLEFNEFHLIDGKSCLHQIRL